MKQYPKVPRYNHGVVKDKLEHIFQDEVYVLEKLDGCNFRFILYDERFPQFYSEDVADIANDNELVYGSRRVVKGTENDKPLTSDGEIDLRFMRGFEALSDIDKEKIREYHEEYGCPLVFYCECMTFHHKDDYSDEWDLIGFEVYKQDDISSGRFKGNPYDEIFEGFLPTSEAFELMQNIGIQTTNVVDVLESIEPEEYEIPETSFGEGVAEGVVIRSDIHKRRVKKVHPKFSEKNDLYFGPSNTDSNEEYIMMKYCTDGRMSKMIEKICVEEGRDLEKDIIPDLAERVYEDIWEEEWYELKDLSISFNPSELNNQVTKRCAGFVERIMKFAEDVDSEPLEIVQNRQY